MTLTYGLCICNQNFHADRLTLFRGRSENSVPKLLDEGRPPICDLVSIDGAHTYQNVLSSPGSRDRAHHF